jgi:PAS domain S-box-containing protein
MAFMQTGLPSTSDNEPPEGASVLLVDDSSANLLALRAILDPLGHNLVEAHSGEEALQLLLHGEFAVVLLDVRMQGMDGFETAKVIRSRERSRHTPIIFLTAYDDGRLPVEQAYELGAVDYLVKPLIPVILRAKVSGFVELFQKAEQIKRQAERLRQMERQEFEQKLAQENARFRALTERSSDAVTLVGMDGTVLYSSPSSRHVLGYEPDEFLGRNGLEIVHPDDQDRIKGRLAELVGGSGTSATVELRVQHKDGSWRWVECVGTNLLAEPAVGAVVVNYRDITERQRTTEALLKSEHQLRAIIDHWPSVIFVKDRDGRYLLANQACEVIGGEPAEKIIGKTDYDYFPKEIADRFRADDLRVLQTATAMRYEEAVPVRGENRTTLTVKFPLCDSAGTPYAVCGIATDITDLKRAEQALRQADRLKDEFLAMLAHELRNPLAPIRNAVEVMRMLGPSDPNHQRARDLIERQVQQMGRLVDDLLDVSRITMGKIVFQKEPVELALVIARAVETSRPLIESRRHKLTVTLPPDPVMVEGDATRLAQVAANLLNNAAKYTGKGGHIWLTVEQGPEEAVLRVRDNGVGISAELLQKVFDLFTQGDRSLDRSEGGLGVGLTLVKSLVEMHRGRVEVHSEGSGKGSEFVVRLPILERRRERRQGNHQAETTRRSSISRRVLVVDDNVDAANSLALFLRMEGHEVHIANDGPTALEAAQTIRPEVVLLDIGLPRMDGYKVARRLRQQAGLHDLLLVAVTGYGQDEDRRRAREAGFDAHLVKPADPGALKQLLDRCERSTR